MFIVKENVELIISGRHIPDDNDIDQIYKEIDGNSSSFCHNLTCSVRTRPYSVRTNAAMLSRELMLRAVDNLIQRGYICDDVGRYQLLHSLHATKSYLGELYGNPKDWRFMESASWGENPN